MTVGLMLLLKGLHIVPQSFNAREGLGWFVTGAGWLHRSDHQAGFNAREGLGWFVTYI